MGATATPAALPQGCGVQARLEKYRADPARDATKLAELKPQDQRYWRLVAERKGQVDDRMAKFRWLLEELKPR